MKVMSVVEIIAVLIMSFPISGEGKFATSGTGAKVSSQATEQDIEYVITEMSFSTRESMTAELYK